jgi:hypothetical protein
MAATITPTMKPAIWNHWGRLKKKRSTAATPPGSGGGPTATCWSVSMAVPDMLPNERGPGNHPVPEPLTIGHVRP